MMSMRAAYVLVVTHDRASLDLVSTSLDDSAFRLRCFDSAPVAWRHLQEEDCPHYDLILLDQEMPGMDGIEFLRNIKADSRFRQTPVVMQTAAGNPALVSDGVEAGAYYYLHKPYSERELLAIVSAALSRLAFPGEPDDDDVVAGTVFEFRTLHEARQLARRLGRRCPEPELATMGLGELFINAIEHGNLNISYAEKAALHMSGGWEDEILRRLALPEWAGHKVRVEVQRDPDALSFVISDCGNGFDWQDYLSIAPERAYDPNGRGIAVARELCFSKLEYQGCGNVVVATVSTHLGTRKNAMNQTLPDFAAQAAALKLKVMVVDDTAVNRQILKVFLERLGYEFLGAADGDEALTTFVRERPDVILMDVMMPQVNGYEATRRIRELSGERWVPIIFISALDRNDNLIDGLEAGGDDFMSKPINFIVLDAKLRSLCRMVELQRRVEAYREHQEREHALAREIVERQTARPGLADKCIQHWVLPAQDFSGDIVAAARAGDGRLFAMLADGCGHGLAPAISVMPVLSMFYSLIEGAAPPDLPQLIDEINRQLVATLPRGRFVAAAMLCLDQRTQQADIWVGGIPMLFWLGADGRIKQRFISNHLSLGIVDTDAELLSLSRVHWQSGDCFVVCSDGLLESPTHTGEPFGAERFAALLEARPAGVDLLTHVRAGLRLQLADEAPADDISLLIVECRDAE
ncbi:MAG TPA: response regulator [Rhodocyclaceae bacterium]|nr:response regulator [Rhodocyclaceae bacterium]